MRTLLLALGLLAWPLAGLADALSTPGTVTLDGQRIDLLAVPEPDLSRAEPAVRERLQQVRREVAELLRAPQRTRAKLARAYGELGEIYHAHAFYLPADPAYANAQRLAPDSFLWAYYRGYLAQQTSRLGDAERHLRRALSLRSDYAPARVRLAQVLVDENRPADAAPLLDGLDDDPALAGAVAFVRGRIALQRRDYAAAVRHFEAVLAREPQASSVRYPLAMAYRGLGQVDKAREALAAHGAGRPGLPDPLVAELEALLGGARTHLHRAMQAVKRRDFPAAAEAFAQALALEPDNPRLRTSLARTLYLAGRPEAARRELATVLKEDPHNPLAHFLTGLLAHADGDLAAARRHYQTALAGDPDHSGAHYYLGLLELQQGHTKAARTHLLAALRGAPRNSQARFLAIALGLQTGVATDKLRAELDAARQHSPEPRFDLLRARLLATRPGPPAQAAKAVQLARDLLAQQPTVDAVITLAMALARQGDYDAAAQQLQLAQVMALGFGRPELSPWLRTLAERVAAHWPINRPFAPHSPLLAPPPINPAGPMQDYPAREPY